MHNISTEVIDRYIHNGRLVATSKSEKLAIKLAGELTEEHSKSTTQIENKIVCHLRIEDASDPEFIRDPSLPPRPKRRRNLELEAENRRKAEEEVWSWRNIILKEINSALCTRSPRYKKEVSAIKHSADVLILAIAASVAKALEVNIVVVAALVAALLRMALSMGVSVFCKTLGASVV
jgi:hypothetical protein